MQRFSCTFPLNTKYCKHLNATIKRNNVCSRARVSVCNFNTIMLYYSRNSLPIFTDRGLENPRIYTTQLIYIHIYVSI